MTDPHTPDPHVTDPHMPDPHMTDEQLSWYLDGAPRRSEGGGQAPGLGADHRVDGADEARIRGHLAGCTQCRHRLGALDAARTVVRTPVPPVPAPVRANAVAAVLARLDDGAHSGPTTASARRPDRRREVPDRPLEPTVLPRRRPVRVAPVAAVAAVVALLVAGVSVALVTQHGSSSQASRVASAPAAPLTTAPSGGQDAAGTKYGSEFGTAGGFAQAEVGGHAVVLAQLGAVSSVPALRSGVGRVLSESNAGGASAGSASLAAPGVTPSRSPANDSTHNGVQPSNSGAATTGPTTTGPTATRPTTTGPTTTGPTTTGPRKSAASSGTSAGVIQSNKGLARALQVCLASARRAAGGRTVEMGASSTYRGAPALVYVFTPATSASSPSPPAGGGNAAHAVVVVASHGCHVLVSTTL